MIIMAVASCNRRHRLFLSAHLLCHLLLLHFALAGRRPVRYKVNGKQTECVYSKFSAQEMVTFSVFVIEALNNGKPKASIRFEGPVAGAKGLLTPWQQEENEKKRQTQDEILLPEQSKGRMTIGREIRSSLLNDWPVLQGQGPHKPNGVFDRAFKIDWTHAGESEDAERARSALLQQTHEESRRHYERHKDKEKPPPGPLHTVVQKRVEPYEETMEIAIEGWYRLCVASEFLPLIAEMDMRTGEQMRGVNPGTGHVWTYEQREYLDERMDLFGEREEEAMDARSQIAKDEDFKESKAKLKYMHDLTSEIMKTQHDRMQRTRAHSSDAQRAAAEMSWSSKLETLLFVVITGAQVYTVHKWLLGNNLLGK